jgi:uncharacterized protein (TIGR02996 family)
VSDEAAFLAALKANPADDTARLVYADWLDEHAEVGKAEYLRLVAALGQMREEYALDQPPVTRLLAMSEQQPADWRSATGSRFSLILYDYRDKILVIKTLRLLKGFGLGEAKAASERLPFRVHSEVTFELAVEGQKLFKGEGGTVVLIHPSELTTLPLRLIYTITAERYVSHGAANATAALQESVTTFADYLSHALGVPLETATQLAADSEVTLAEDVEASEFDARWNAFYQLLPHLPPDEYDFDPDAQPPDWGIWVNYHRRVVTGNL